MRVYERMSWRILKGLLKETTETLRRTVSVNSQPPSHILKTFDSRRSHAHTPGLTASQNVKDRLLKHQLPVQDRKLQRQKNQKTPRF